MNTSLSTSAARGRMPGGLLALVLALLALLFAYQLLLNYRHQIEIAEISVRNLAALFETRLDATLRHTDADLQALAIAIPVEALNQKAIPRYQREINAELDGRLFNMEEMAGYRVHDAAGDTLYASDNAHTARVNIADRPYFRQLRDDSGVGLAFSDVITGRSLGRPVLVIVRALRDERGKFMGIVHGMIELQYYQKQFADARPRRQRADRLPAAVTATPRSCAGRTCMTGRTSRWRRTIRSSNASPPAKRRRRCTMRRRPTTSRASSASRSCRTILFISPSVWPRDEVLTGWRAQALVVTLSTLARCSDSSVSCCCACGACACVKRESSMIWRA